MKRMLISLLLVLALALPLCAVAQTYAPGTYAASTNGMKGPIEIEVTLSEERIESVVVTKSTETYGIGQGLKATPIEAIPAAIVEGQTLAVDMVSGATITSAVLLAAVEDALKQAGADVDAIKAAPLASPAKDQEMNVDVVIAGAGAAGLAAGIQAATDGANVLILEKQDITGGATTRSGGKILAAGSSIQAEQGIEDDVDQMFDYLKGVGGDMLDEARVRLFAEGSVETLDWLVEMGTQMGEVEAIHSSLKPWRVHNAKGAGGMTDGHGGQYTVPMTNRYESLGGKILYGATADGLITGGDGAVRGMTATMRDGSKLTVNANAAVIATGGYAQNRAYYEGQSAVEGYVTSVPKGNVGDGLTMAQAVGAKVTIPDYAMVVYCSFTCGVGINEEAGLIVNKQGNRFANEYSYQYHVGDQLAKTGSNLAYYICDASDPNPTVQYGLSLEATPKADSIEALAALIGVDAAALKATVERYNALCAAGVDEDFGKIAEKMVAVNGPTYAAIKMQPSVTVSYGGLTTDERARVLSEAGAPISGLYAAGEVAFEGLFGTEYPCCGMAIGSAVFYGRIAGTQAAQQK